MKQKWTNLSCFNPFVMASTFIIEISLFLYLLIKVAKKDKKTWIIMLALLLLAGFQGSEYLLCQTDGYDGIWVRAAFVIITILPPLGVHLVSVISGVKSQWSKALVPLSYLNGLVWVLIFGTGLQAFNSYGCAANYAIFHVKSPYGELYELYYYGWLFITLFLAFHLSNRTDNKDARKKLIWMIFGYLTFIIPAMSFQFVLPHLNVAVPSVMCGFAIIYAFILVFAIVRPQDQKSRE